MEKHVNQLQSASTLLKSLPELRKFVKRNNDIIPVETAVKSVFLQLNPHLDSSCVAAFRVINVDNQKIVLGATNSVWWSLLHYQSTDLSRALGKSIKIHILCDDGSNVDPRTIALE